MKLHEALLLESNSLEFYIKGPLEITSGKQKEYFQWQWDNHKMVKPKSYKDDLKLKEIVEDHLNYNKTKKKDCYRTALFMSQESNDILYVEGMISFMGVPIEHAWNIYKKDYHFDITKEVLFKGEFAEEYMSILVLTNKEAQSYALDLGKSGPYLSEYFRKK